MNLGEVKSSVKRQFGDESGVQVTDADIIRWVKQGQEEIVRENEEVLDALLLFDVTQGQDEYTFPVDLFVFRSLRIKISDESPFIPINAMSLSQFEKSTGVIEGFPVSGTSNYILTTYERTMFIHPVPSFTRTDGFKLLYSKTPTVPVSDTEELGLPLEYHYAVLKYCLVQAYEMDENWEASASKLVQYQADINRAANRPKRESRDVYPTITINPEDLD